MSASKFHKFTQIHRHTGTCKTCSHAHIHMKNLKKNNLVERVQGSAGWREQTVLDHVGCLRVWMAAESQYIVERLPFKNKRQHDQEECVGFE